MKNGDAHCQVRERMQPRRGQAYSQEHSPPWPGFLAAGSRLDLQRLLQRSLALESPLKKSGRVSSRCQDTRPLIPWASFFQVIVTHSIGGPLVMMCDSSTP